MPATIKDVAAHCGLSVATVSKALNDYGDISEATRKRVRAAARELGYRPNPLARALKTRASRTLGLVAGEESHFPRYHQEVLDHFRREVEWRGYDLLLVGRNLGAAPLSFLEHSLGRGLDGLLLCGVDFYAPEVVELVASDLPLATVDHAFQGRPCVAGGDAAGMAELVRFAAGRGHRRLACLHGPRDAKTDSRLGGLYRAAAALELHLPEARVREVPAQDAAALYQAVRALLEGRDPPTCLLLPGDEDFDPAWRAVRDLGLSMPGQVSLAGYGGLPALQALRPRLTTQRQDTRRIGVEAAMRLIEAIEQPRLFDAGVTVVADTLLPGETVARLE